MSEVAALIADMVRAGVDPDLIGRTAAALADRGATVTVDQQAERRRMKDRERKRLRNSAESAESAETPSPIPDKDAPHTPQEINPSPIPPSPPKGGSSPARQTPASELSAVLDTEHASALVEHRQRLRKPLTARAAKLLAERLATFADPNAAADRMIEKGWQSIEPGWGGLAAAPTATPGEPDADLAIIAPGTADFDAVQRFRGRPLRLGNSGKATVTRDELERARRASGEMFADTG